MHITLPIEPVSTDLILVLRALEAAYCGANARELDEMAREFAEVPDLAAFFWQIASVQELRRLVADADLTPTQRATVEALRKSGCGWVRTEADKIAALDDQEATHDATEEGK